MIKSSLARRGGLLAAVMTSILLVGAAPASAAPGDGSAYGVLVDITLAGQSAVQAGPFAASITAGPTTNTLAQVSVPGIITTGVINTSAMLDPNTGTVTSQASTANVGLPLLNTALGTSTVTLAEATCTATQQGIVGSTTLTGATFGSLGAVGATPAPNTKLNVKIGPVLVATITLNEQIQNPDGSLTVNAIHVRLVGSGPSSLGSGDVIVSSATCGPAAPPIPLASGAGLWIGLGLLGAIAVPASTRILRRRATQAG